MTTSRHGLKPALHSAAVSLQPLLRECRISYYRWALREIHPLHPDVPHIVRRLRTLLDQRGPQPMLAVWRWL